MAYPTSFLRLVVIGTLYGSETFTWSLALRRNFDPDAVVPAEVPQGVVDAVTNFHTATGNNLGAQAVLTAIKLNEIGTDGKYVSQGDTVMHEFVTGVPGGGTSVHPSQCAVAVTLRTAIKRGRASSGRFYLPKLASAVGSDGRMTAPEAQQIAQNATTFLTDLQTALNDDWQPAVMSNIGTGASQGITLVECGRVIDTIRSRRTSLEEDRQPGTPLGP